MSFIDTLRKKLNLSSWFSPDEILKKDNKKRVIYILCLVAENGLPERHGTDNLDHIKQAILRIPNDRIYYIGRRWGKEMSQIQTFAITSQKMQQVVCDKNIAFQRLAAAVISDPK